MIKFSSTPPIVDYNGSNILANSTSFFTPIPSNGFLEELPKPYIDQQVNIHSSIRKLEIVARLPSKEKQKSRYKRDDGLEEENTTDEVEGEEKLEEEKNRGVRLIVDEIEDKSSSSSQIKDRKTFSKQGQIAGKNENGKSLNSGKRQRVAPSVPTAEKKKVDGNDARKSNINKNFGQQTTKTMPTTTTTKMPKTTAIVQKPIPSSQQESKSSPKERPPSIAQVPVGPPMPPPGVVPPPQIPQSPSPSGPQVPPPPPPSIESVARPSGLYKMTNYKLIYFDARGICEPIRLLFHYAHVPFDDVRISRKQWLALKDSKEFLGKKFRNILIIKGTVYGKVPILEVDGKPLTYCHTIARYLARQFGLAGRDNWEQAKVDEISDFHADVAMDLQPYMYVVAGFHQGDKQTLRQAIFLPNVEKHFPVYVNLLKLSGSGFFLPSGITWVDFVIAEYMTTVRHFEPQILDKYPAIIKFVRKVQTQPQIFEYITNREHQPV
uniref:glutathione transferase n=1 Tax=Meloidogyne hapla TaxID=6305 RepID=A0A1I8B3Y8_MELHA